MESDETSGGSGPPWKGIGLTAILTVVSGTILSRFDLPHGIGNFAEIVGALGLIAGSIIGWVFRGMIKEMSLVRATLGFFVLGVASAIAILIIAGSWVGMVPAIAVVFSVALFTFCLGALCAIAGIKLSE